MSSRAGRGPGRAWLGSIPWRFGPTREEAVAAQAQTGGGGTAGNERLTGSTSLLLLLLFAAEGVTILFLGPLLPEHIFIGMVLIPPVALKLGSTGYRMVRYYGGSPTYRAEGPPRIALRAMAPVLVLSTLALLGTGVGLIVVGPGHETLLTLHKASFVVWVAFIAVHALAYVMRIHGSPPRTGDAPLAGRGCGGAGPAGRWSSVPSWSESSSARSCWATPARGRTGTATSAPNVRSRSRPH